MCLLLYKGSSDPLIVVREDFTQDQSSSEHPLFHPLHVLTAPSRASLSDSDAMTDYCDTFYCFLQLSTKGFCPFRSLAT